MSLSIGSGRSEVLRGPSVPSALISVWIVPKRSVALERLPGLRLADQVARVETR